MSLVVRKPTPGEQAYADWCDAPESDLARYWHRMNRADKAKWEKFGARVAADRGAVEALDGIGPLKARIEALEIIAGANENTMRQWEGEAKRLRHELKGTVKERERLREVLRAVLMEPDPIKRNQLAAPVLTSPGGAVAR